ncbi:MAG: hypothetical protein Fur0041_10840 [Bacteroidia bacterium]
MLLLFSRLLSVQAQENRLLILGTVYSAKDSSVIEGCVVTTDVPERVAVCNKYGRYALLTERKTGILVQYRITGYQTKYVALSPSLLAKAKGDTLHLDVILEPKRNLIEGITVRPGQDTVIGNWRFFIEDYMFEKDGRFVLLTFEKSLKASKVMLVDEQQKILSSFDVPGEAKELYRDYLGDINVMCKDSAFRVKIVPPSTIMLLALPYKDFCDRMLPCVDTVGGKILFSNYHKKYPAFSYFTYNPADTTIQLIRYIVDLPLLKTYNWEYDFLKPKDRLYARKMAAYTGIDERIIAATMTGFPESIYYTPLYAPMFVVHDTICIFDHYSDSLFLYDASLKCIGKSKISYHHPKNWKEWDRSLHQDEVTREIYARFEKGGFYYLKKIDIKTGNITGTFKISVQHCKHIRIRNGFVYYIYRPYESVQKKFLYREAITLSN